MNQTKPLGIFDADNDIGNVKHPGSSVYESSTDQYIIKGSGTNMWFGEDEFHFLWKKISGDFVIDTRMQWIGEGMEPHRKGGLVIRENLEKGSRYISAAFHGDGLMSMQYRLQSDSMTLEQSSKDRYHSLPDAFRAPPCPSQT